MKRLIKVVLKLSIKFNSSKLNIEVITFFLRAMFILLLPFMLMQCTDSNNNTESFENTCKEYKNTILLLDKLIKYDSINDQLFKFKGICYNELELPDSAIKYLTRANSLSKKNGKSDAEIYYEIGISFDLKKSYDCARGMYYYAYLNDSTNTKYTFVLAKYYYSMDDFKNAIIYANKTLALNSFHAQSYFMKGSIYYIQKQYTQALSEIEKGLQIQPFEAMAYFDKGLIYYDINDFDKAYFSFTMAILLEPNTASFYLQRAFTLLAMGFPKFALNDCEKAIQKDSTFAEVYHLKAIIYALYFDKNTACQFYQKYKKMNINYISDTTFNYCQ